jgi:hypothetical protein
MIEELTRIKKDDWEIIALILGWGGWAADRLTQYLINKRVSFAVTSEDSKLYLINNSQRSLEVLRCRAEVSDISARPDLAKREWVFAQFSEVITPGERRLILKLDGLIAEKLEEICAPLVRQAKEHMPGKDIPRFARFRIHVQYKEINGRVPKEIVFDRWLSGHPSSGYGVGYSPYHHEQVAPLHRKVWKKAKTFTAALRHPIKWYQNEQAKKPLAFHLQTSGVLVAMSQNTLSEEDGRKRLKKIFKKFLGRSWEDPFLELWGSYKQRQNLPGENEPSTGAALAPSEAADTAPKMP